MRHRTSSLLPFEARQGNTPKHGEARAGTPNESLNDTSCRNTQDDAPGRASQKRRTASCETMAVVAIVVVVVAVVVVVGIFVFSVIYRRNLIRGFNSGSHRFTHCGNKNNARSGEQQPPWQHIHRQFGGYRIVKPRQSD